MYLPSDCHVETPPDSGPPFPVRWLLPGARKHSQLHSNAVELPEIGELYLRACARERWAAEALVNALGGMVVATVRRNGVDVDHVEDVASTTWLKLFEHCGRIRDPNSVPGWLKTTARNEAMQWHRTRGRERPAAPDDLPDGGFAEPGYEIFEDDEEAQVRRKHVRQTWTQVDARCQRMFDLKTRVPVLSNSEVARRLGIPVGSVGPTYRRCIDKLRALLEGRVGR